MATARMSLREEQDDLRSRMRALGMEHGEIAAEFARRYQLRPRAAWRHAIWRLTEPARQRRLPHRGWPEQQHRHSEGHRHPPPSCWEFRRRDPTGSCARVGPGPMERAILSVEFGGGRWSYRDPVHLHAQDAWT